MANWRNRQLLNWAKNCPRCMRCWKYNDGDVVSAHSNQQRDGKGMGIKAHDYRIAFLCSACHMDIDQGKTMTKTEKIEAWEDAHRATIGWLFEAGVLEVRSVKNGY